MKAHLYPRFRFFPLLAVLLLPLHAGSQEKIRPGGKVPSLEGVDPAGKKVRLPWKGGKWRILLWAKDDKRFHLVLGDLVRLFGSSNCLREKAELWVIFSGGPQEAPARDAARTGTSGKVPVEVRVLFDPAGKNWDTFGIIAVPTTQIVSPEGILRFQLAGCPQDFLERTALAVKEKMGIATPFGKAPGKEGAGGERPALARYVSTARRLLAKGMPSLAAGILEKALKGRAPDLEAGSLLGFILLSKGDSARAEEIFRSLAKAHPSALEPALGAAACLIAAGKLGEASAELARLERLHPGSSRVIYFQGLLLEKKGDLQGAAARYKKAFLLDHPELGL